MSRDLDYVEEGFLINDRYRVDRSLGSGGFAVVYEGTDTQIDRSVAIKVMNTAGGEVDEEMQEQLVERFSREAKLAAKVEHPNVATIFDYGVVDNYEDPFIVMELMEGYDLEEQLQNRGAMAADRVLDLFDDTLVALGLAHEAGIVHKDIKPANLFLKKPGTRVEALCVLDFGVAHLTQAVQSRLTRAGELMGTPAYLPPEYASERRVTPALDVYQMALVLVEMLTGEIVVDKSHPPATLLAHVEGELPIPLAYMESPLGPLLEKALAAEPEDRFENGLEFADRLEELSPLDIPELEEEAETVEIGDYAREGARVREAADGGFAPNAEQRAGAEQGTQNLYGNVGGRSEAERRGQQGAAEQPGGADAGGQSGAPPRDDDRASDALVDQSPETPNPTPAGRNEPVESGEGGGAGASRPRQGSTPEADRTEVARGPTAPVDDVSGEQARAGANRGPTLEGDFQPGAGEESPEWESPGISTSKLSVAVVVLLLLAVGGVGVYLVVVPAEGPEADPSASEEAAAANQGSSASSEDEGSESESESEALGDSSSDVGRPDAGRADAGDTSERLTEQPDGGTKPEAEEESGASGPGGRRAGTSDERPAGRGKPATEESGKPEGSNAGGGRQGAARETPESGGGSGPSETEDQQDDVGVKLPSL